MESLPYTISTLFIIIVLEKLSPGKSVDSYCPRPGVEFLKLHRHRQIRYMVDVNLAWGLRGVAVLVSLGPDFIPCILNILISAKVPSELLQRHFL